VGVIDTFVKAGIAAGHNIICKQECEVSREDAKDADLLVTLGGDHTFLLASSLIKNNETPLLGLNTYREMFTGALTTGGIDYRHRQREIERILK